MNADVVADINLIAEFLANEQISRLSEIDSVDTIVLCGSAVLQCSEAVFAALKADPRLGKTLVISGGIGHSTQYLYDVVARHPLYHNLSAEIQGLPEAAVLYKIFQRFFDAAKIEAAGLRVLIDDISTNCGANAVETHALLRKHNIGTNHLVIVQDPTMSRRSLASFEKVYNGSQSVPKLTTFPSFVPRIVWQQSRMVYEIPTIETDGLWDTDRFCELVLGEIPRLRDDASGYGPQGKDFIARVDIPREVEQAWRRANKAIETQRALALSV